MGLEIHEQKVILNVEIVVQVTQMLQLYFFDLFSRYSKRIAKFGTHTNIDIDEISPVKIISLPKPPKVDSKEAQEKYIVQRFAAFGVLKEKKDCKKLEILSGIDREKIWEIYQTLIS